MSDFGTFGQTGAKRMKEIAQTRELVEEIARLREELEAAKYALKWDLSEARALAERWRDAMGASPEGGNPLPWELEPSDPGQHVPHKRWLPEFE